MDEWETIGMGTASRNAVLFGPVSTITHGRTGVRTKQRELAARAY
jgi:hypothetical protein